MLKKIGIISKEGDSHAKTYAKHMASEIVRMGIKTYAYPNPDVTKVNHVPSLEKMGSLDLDVILAFSGDGTVLSLVRSLNTSVPVLAINVGGRGILSEIPPSRLIFIGPDNLMPSLLNSQFKTEHRIRISASVLPPNGKMKPLPSALNEMLLIRSSYGKTPDYFMNLGSQSFHQRMDGLILSTPTGSTGHSFSYGSPFMQGTLNAFVLTPLAPVRRFVPIVLSGDSEIVLSADAATDLVIDGQVTHRIEPNSQILLKRDPKDAVFVRFKEGGDYRQLVNMLSLENGL